MMRQADIERTELVRLPASGRRLEAETLRVDQRNDGEGCSAIGQVDAANAAVILDKDAQEVLVSDALGMASRLDTCHHEAILGGDLLHHTLLLPLPDDLVLNVRQIERHGRFPIGLASSRPLNSLVDQPVAIGVAMVARLHCQDLLNKEADAMRG